MWGPCTPRTNHTLSQSPTQTSRNISTNELLLVCRSTSGGRFFVFVQSHNSYTLSSMDCAWPLNSRGNASQNVHQAKTKSRKDVINYLFQNEEQERLRYMLGEIVFWNSRFHVELLNRDSVMSGLCHRFGRLKGEAGGCLRTSPVSSWMYIQL